MIRYRELNNKEVEKGKVIYWMSREQRIGDNWSLINAQELGKQLNEEVIVFFNIITNPKKANIRHYDFMLKGLIEIEKKLSELNIRFVVKTGRLIQNLKEVIKEQNAKAIITDYSPLKGYDKWIKEIKEELNEKIRIIETDSHNVVPVWETSNKQEFSARTIRPKIHKLLNIYLTEFPTIQKQEVKIINKNNWEDIYKNLNIDENIKPITWIKPGEKEALKTLKDFINTKLSNYTKLKNDPTKDNLSNMSPYLHFGQISSQRIALEIQKSKISNEEKEAYLEELIVRRELAENFCTFNKEYDTLNGAPKWAIVTLNKHIKDQREYIYTKKQLEEAKTHDEAWNTCQKEMINKGKMHGYMRMYWAKKILEWTATPEEAVNIAIYLNDKYKLDGRDPNGYTGILWSIGGLHDRPWFERDIFGTVRYMNYNGLKRKFDLNSYINTSH